MDTEGRYKAYEDFELHGECAYTPACLVMSNSLRPHGLQPTSLMGFSRQEYWSGLPGDLPDPGVEPTSLASPALAGGFFTTEPPGKPYMPGRHLKQPVVFFKCQLYIYIHFC